MSVLAPYYRTDALHYALVAEAQSWLGTPFSENCAIKGRQGGVSCARYLVACHAAAGACDHVELPVLPVEQVRFWHQHHGESMMLKWLEAAAPSGRIRRVDEAEPWLVGDVVFLKIEQTEHHAALFTGSHLYHVTTAAGVVRHSIHHAEVMEMVRCVYRLHEPAV